MEEDKAEKLDRIVRALLSGRRLRVGPEDASNEREIRVAARLAATGRPQRFMQPALRRKLKRALTAVQRAD